MNGYIVKFEKTNVYSITPYRIVFSKNDVYLLILYYDEYHEDDDVFYVDVENHTLLTVRNILEIIFLT